MTPGPRAGVVHVEGLILSQRNVGESDRVLDVLLRGRGRQSVWCKKARGQARQQAVQALAPFVSASMHVRPRTEGATLVGHDEVAPRAGLRTRLSALRRAGQLVALVQALFLADEPADAALDVLLVALDHLAEGRVSRAAGAYPRLLSAAGLMPPLQACGRCQNAFSPARLPGIDASALCCLRCVPLAQALVPELHRSLAGHRIDTEPLAASVESIVLAWAGWHVGRPLEVRGWQRES